MDKYTPCGGCGATEPDQRCIGCMHPFTEEEAKEQAVKGIALIGIGQPDPDALATKLHQANETIKELERQNEKLKATATGWRPLLESVLREDKTFGTISNPTIDKIKKFLYGE